MTDRLKIRLIMKIANEPISMETPLRSDADLHLCNFIDRNRTPRRSALHAEGHR